MKDHILDNPVWSALVSGNQNLALGNEKAKFFQKEVSLFVGIPEITSENLAMLENTIPFQEPVAIFTMEEDFDAAPWIRLRRIVGFQMMYPGGIKEAINHSHIMPLNESHINQMVSLASLTNPGPFSSATILFGDYYGIFEGDRLVSMAGNRFHSGSFVEISAVCTHPDYVGRGYARQLIHNQISRIQKSASSAYLHVREDNVRPVKIYKEMGFEIRTKMYIHILQKK